MQTSALEDNEGNVLTEGENFSVVRLKQNILGRSYFGGILTSRQGDST